jgi:MFS family permease
MIYSTFIQKLLTEFINQVLAGPAFILIFTFTGIVLSLVVDKFQNKYNIKTLKPRLKPSNFAINYIYFNRRVLILALCLAWWSSMTVLTGFATAYWQLLLLRIGLGIG